MAKAFAEIAAGGEADGLGHHEWLGLLLDHEASWRQDKRLPARLRVAKLRQQACVEDVDYRNPRGLDRAKSWPRANGSTPTTIWRSSAQPASARVGWPRRSATRRAATTDRSSTSVCLGSSRPSPWRAATDAIRAFCATWAAPICSFSMTGAWSRSTPPPGTISWKSSRNATDAAPR